MILYIKTIIYDFHINGFVIYGFIHKQLIIYDSTHKWFRNL